MQRLVSIVIAFAVLINQQTPADEGSLDLYFIDVEGGAATLIVTPFKESILIDSGYPDNQARDLDENYSRRERCRRTEEDRPCRRFPLASRSLR